MKTMPAAPVWPAPTATPIPTDLHSTLAHLVARHGWEPRDADVSMVQAHRYAHGLDSRPDLADANLDHNHIAAAKQGKRPLTWAIIAWNVLMAVWIVYGLAATGNQYNDCVGEAYSDACQAGTSVGAAIAIGGILFLTAIVDVILGVIWMVTKKNN